MPTVFAARGPFLRAGSERRRRERPPAGHGPNPLSSGSSGTFENARVSVRDDAEIGGERVGGEAQIVWPHRASWTFEMASPVGDLGKAPVADAERQRPVRVEDAVPRRHDARHCRAIGFHRPVGRVGTQAVGQPDPLPRSLRAHSKYRARVTPAKRGRGGQLATTADPEARTSGERRAAMTWAQRLKRFFLRSLRPARPAAGR